MSTTTTQTHRTDEEESTSSWKVRLRRWGPWIAVFLLGVFVGQADGGSTEELDAAIAAQKSAEQEVSDLEQQLSSTQDEAETAKDDAEAARAEADNAMTAARRELEAEFTTKQEDLEAEYAAKQAELDQRAAALDERESSIAQQEEIAAMSTFGDGVYEVGVDIVPGKYKTQGTSSMCYWQKSPVSASGDILDNDNVNGPTTVVIQDGILFTSSRCGTWQRYE